MPIANCIVSPDCCSAVKESLSFLWARESGKSEEHMTINVIQSHQQFGHHYPVMVNLLLPAAWSDENVSCLQTGLAQALSIYFCLPVSRIHIVTLMVQSGHVVENGHEIRW